MRELGFGSDHILLQMRNGLEIGRCLLKKIGAISLPLSLNTHSGTAVVRIHFYSISKCNSPEWKDHHRRLLMHVSWVFAASHTERALLRHNLQHPTQWFSLWSFRPAIFAVTAGLVQRFQLRHPRDRWKVIFYCSPSSMSNVKSLPATNAQMCQVRYSLLLYGCARLDRSPLSLVGLDPNIMTRRSGSFIRSVVRNAHRKAAK